MAWTYLDLKTADAALSPQQPDPEAAAAALNAQTVVVFSDIQTNDARGIILVSGEWAAIKRLAAQTLSGSNPPTSADQAIMAAGLCIDSLTLTDVLHTADDATWAAVQRQMGALEAAGVLSADSAAKWAAMRSQTVPVWQPRLDAGIIQTARERG